MAISAVILTPAGGIAALISSRLGNDDVVDPSVPPNAPGLDARDPPITGVPGRPVGLRAPEPDGVPVPEPGGARRFLVAVSAPDISVSEPEPAPRLLRVDVAVREMCD